MLCCLGWLKREGRVDSKDEGIRREEDSKIRRKGKSKR